MITSSLDYSVKREQLYRVVVKLLPRRDGIRMLDAIDKLVTELSKAEVIARRERKVSTRQTIELLSLINTRIEEFESITFFAVLCSK